MNALWITLAIVGLLLIAGVVVLAWLRHTLLSGIAVIDVNEVDPALKQTIDRLELDYAVAEELGYDGCILLGIESQLNAAKAALNPDATMIYVVSLPGQPDEQWIRLTTSDLCPIPALLAGVFSISSVPNVELVPVK